MTKRDPKESLIYDDEAIAQTTNQIMDSYASGVVDHPDGQFHFYNQDEK